jgi:hypothetical protein
LDLQPLATGATGPIMSSPTSTTTFPRQQPASKPADADCRPHIFARFGKTSMLLANDLFPRIQKFPRLGAALSIRDSPLISIRCSVTV